MAAPSRPSWARCLLLGRTPLCPLFPMPPAHPPSPVCGGGALPVDGGPKAAGGNPPWHHPQCCPRGEACGGSVLPHPQSWLLAPWVHRTGVGWCWEIAPSCHHFACASPAGAELTLSQLQLQPRAAIKRPPPSTLLLLRAAPAGGVLGLCLGTRPNHGLWFARAGKP